MFLVNFGFLLLFAYPLDVLLTASQPWITQLVNYFNDVNATRQRDGTGLEGVNTTAGLRLQSSDCMNFDNYLILLVIIQFSNPTELQTADRGTKFRQGHRCLPEFFRVLPRETTFYMQLSTLLVCDTVILTLWYTNFFLRTSGTNRFIT
jgi:hypothetical protein